MNRRNAIKLAVLAFLVAGVAALYFSPARTYLTKEHLRDLIAWLRGLWYGPIVLIALYAAGCVLAIPASVFVIAAGVIWGWKLGAVYAIAGGMLGAVPPTSSADSSAKDCSINSAAPAAPCAARSSQPDSRACSSSA